MYVYIYMIIFVLNSDSRYKTHCECIDREHVTSPDNANFPLKRGRYCITSKIDQRIEGEKGRWRKKERGG